MSSNVDKRVVEMEFDNSKFERNVKESMGTLNKLKESLNMKGVSDGLDEVQVKFSSFEVAAITAISNITNRVVNLGIQLVKSLSTDNISAGWEKFGQKTQSVATMASQSIKIAGQELTDYSEKMNAINAQLEKLNWFTDQTSYNFTDMVDNIGKFTAAGQDLDASVDAMMGIANWAALSGQNATTASRAMYQLSQALSKGYVQLIDYKSIQNANMDTQEFRQTVLDTAVALGELTKEGENYITKTGKKFTRNQFTEELSEKWFSSDVLTKSLKKYSGAVERIYEISEETGLTATEVMARYGDELDEFGLKAFNAAQEARTFTDVINSVKDAVSTGWMTTAEKVFGAYDDSKELWTDLANELYDVFAEGGNFRNEILNTWKDLAGRADIFQHGGDNQGAFWNIYDSIIAVVDLIKGAWNDIFPKSEFSDYDDKVSDIANKFKIFTENLRENTARVKELLTNNKILTNIFKGLFTILKVGLAAIKTIWYAVNPLVATLKDIIKNVFDKISYYLSDLSFMENIINNIYETAYKVSEVLSDIIEGISSGDVLGNFISFLQDIFDIIKNSDLITNIKDSIVEFISSFQKSGGTLNNFKKIITGILSILNSTWKLIKKLIDYISVNVSPLVSSLIKTLAKLAGTALGKVVEFLGTIIQTLSKLIDFESLISEITDNIAILSTDGINLSIKPFATLIESFKALLSAAIVLLKAIVPIITVAVQVITKLVNAISTFIVKLFSGKTAALKVAMVAVIAILAMFVVWAATIKSSISEVFNNLSGLLNAIAYKIYASILMTITSSLLMMAASIILLSFIDVGSLVKAMSALIILSGVLMAFMYVIKNVDPKSIRRQAKNARSCSMMISKISSAMIKAALSLILFGTALKLISGIKNISQGVGTLVVLVGAIVGISAVAKLLTNKDIKNMNRLAHVCMAFSGALAIFGTTLAIIAVASPLLSIGKIIALVASFTAMTAVFVGLSKLVKAADAGQFALFGASMILFGAAMIEFASCIDIIGVLPISKVWNGVAAISAFTVMMALIIKVVGIFSSLKLLVFASGMLALGKAMAVFAAIMVTLSVVEEGSLKKSRQCIQSFIVMMALIVKVVDIFSSLNLLVFASGMILLGVAMSEFATVMIALSAISWSNMSKALIAITTLIGSVAGILIAFDKLKINTLKIIPFAAAMIVLSVALTGFAIAMAMFSSISWAGIAKGLIGLAAAFVITYAAGILMKSVIITILEFAAAALLLSIGILALSIAFSTFVTAITVFADSFVTSFQLLLETIIASAELIKDTLITFGAALLESINALIPIIVQVVTDCTLALLQSVQDVAPKFLETIVILIKSVLSAVQEVVPDLLDAVATIITEVLKFLKNNIYSWTVSLTEIFILSIEALTTKLPELIEALTEFFVTFIESSLISLSTKIYRLITSAVDFVLEFIAQLGKAFKNTSEKMVDTFYQFGLDLMAGLWNGIVEALADMLGGIPWIGDDIKRWMQDSLQIHSPSKMTEEMGVYLMEGLGVGMHEGLDKTCKDASDTMSEVISAVGNTIQEGIDDDNLTITPVLDLSNVNAGANSISSMMSSISGTKIGVSTNMATNASREIGRVKSTSAINQNGGNTTNNTSNDSYNVTFNVTTDDPETLAEQLDEILQRNRLRTGLAKGGV